LLTFLVLENYQKEDGIEVPEVLRPWIPGRPEFLPYVKELPKAKVSKGKKQEEPKKSEGAKDSASKKADGLQKNVADLKLGS
jgi:hypothetical protein